MSTPRLFDPRQLLSLGLAWEIFLVVTFPIAGCAFAGWWLDRLFQTRPWLLLASFPAALAFVALLVRYKARTWYAALQEDEPSTPRPPAKKRP